MSKVARIDATVIQIDERAKCLPGKSLEKHVSVR
jgi:hypothetical protein